MPPRTFSDAVYPWYSRASNVVESQPMFWKHGMPPIESEHVVSRGFQRNEGGLEMWERQGAIVFTAEWPYATELHLTASAQRPANLRIGSGKAFGRVVWFGTLAFPGGGKPTTQILKIPEGQFDSGMNELIFESDEAADAQIVLRNWSFDDLTSYVAPYPGTKD
jgi:hypothetical protein